MNEDELLERAVAAYREEVSVQKQRDEEFLQQELEKAKAALPPELHPYLSVERDVSTARFLLAIPKCYTMEIVFNTYFSTYSINTIYQLDFVGNRVLTHHNLWPAIGRSHSDYMEIVK